MKPLIKICGIKDFNTLNQLIGLDEIDFIGFIFFGKITSDRFQFFWIYN